MPTWLLVARCAHGSIFESCPPARPKLDWRSTSHGGRAKVMSVLPAPPSQSRRTKRLMAFQSLDPRAFVRIRSDTTARSCTRRSGRRWRRSPTSSRRISSVRWLAAPLDRSATSDWVGRARENGAVCERVMDGLVRRVRTSRVHVISLAEASIPLPYCVVRDGTLIASHDDKAVERFFGMARRFMPSPSGSSRPGCSARTRSAA